jgi:hypothetical protein
MSRSEVVELAVEKLHSKTAEEKQPPASKKRRH